MKHEALELDGGEQKLIGEVNDEVGVRSFRRIFVSY